jgi:hypothetical protein
MMSPVVAKAQVTTPGKRVARVSRTSTATLANPYEMFSATSLVTTVSDMNPTDSTWTKALRTSTAEYTRRSCRSGASRATRWGE